jgi:ankyrin repeat protein
MNTSLIAAATTPSNLFDAVVSGSLDDVKSFLTPEANVEFSEPSHRPAGHWSRSPLDMASVLGKFEVVEALLRHGATPHCRNLAGATPLHGASTKGHAQVVEMLLLYGSDLEAEIANTKGFTPLWCSVFFKKVDMVLLLLKNGADVNVSSSSGTTPLMEACSKLDFRPGDPYNIASMVRILIDFGACIATQDSEGRTAYDMAKIGKNRAVIAILEDELYRRHSAFSMGEHERLGRNSLVKSLKPELLTMVLELADPSLYKK